jgi:amino acid transporter
MSKTNEHRVASNLLIMQAVAVTLMCSAFLFVPSVNGIYWLFTDLSTELYLLMYAMMFIAALLLKAKSDKQQQAFRVPGGLLGYRLVCLMGILGCAITLLIGFIPPENTFENARHFAIIFGAGLISMIVPALLIIGFKKQEKS